MPLASGIRLAVYEIQAPLPPSTILHVVTLYSVEECDGAHFLTMELIDGQPLDRMISENGLPVEPSPSTTLALVVDGFTAAYGLPDCPRRRLGARLRSGGTGYAA